MTTKYRKIIPLFMLLCMTAGKSVAQEKGEQHVITFEVGSLQVSTLSEGQQKGNSAVLLYATSEMIGKYIPDGTYPMATNAFLVRTSEHTVLIDAGYGRLLPSALQSLNVTSEQVDVILITHMHSDHIGGLLRDGQAVFPTAELYVSQAEYDFWTSDQAMQQAAPERRNGFTQARKVIAAYKNRLHLFQPDEPDADGAELVPGIRGIVSYGHTPGHTAYLIHSADKRLLIWGDLTHAMAIQMSCPDVAVMYDTDPAQAVTTRKKILNYVAEHDIAVGGMHIAFPAVGNIRKAENGGYDFTPFCLCLGI